MDCHGIWSMPVTHVLYIYMQSIISMNNAAPIQRNRHTKRNTLKKMMDYFVSVIKSTCYL